MVEMKDISDAPGVAMLFGDDMPDRPVLQAGLAGLAPAMAVADAPRNPAWCLIKLAGWNCAFVGGQPERSDVVAALERLRMGQPIGLVSWAGNVTYLASLALPTIAVPRTEFCRRPAVQASLPRWLDAVDSSCRVVPFDGAWLERCLWREDYLACYGSPAGFLANAIGFLLVRDTEVLSEACATFVAAGAAEIGAVTAEPWRGRSYAAIVAAHVIEACERQGLETLWSCDRQHEASLSVARKVGYVPVREYEHLYYVPC